MTDASTTGAVERHHPRPDITDLTIMEWAAYRCDDAGAVARILGARLDAARRAEDAAWNDAIEAAEAAYAQGFAAIRALRRAAPTEGEAQSLDDTTRAVLDRAERIVAGQSQQEQRTAEIFLRPTEGEA